MATRNRIAIVALTAAALGLLILQSLLHGHLTGIDEYDDGVYLGSSLDLIHGIMPYRDFAFIQPPMAAVWLLPFAALSFLTGTAHALEAARIFIDLIAAANVAMVGLLVRRRPTPQVLVAMGVMAAYPATVMSAQTVLLEPLLVSGCLAGLLCLFDGNQVTASRRRILAAGLLFGVAGATKLWAALPFAAAVLVTWPSGPMARRRLVAGGAAGFLGCSLPFVIGSPAGFIQQVFVIQAIRNGGGYPAAERLADLTGLPGLYSLVFTHPAAGTVLLAAVIAALAALCLIAFTGRGQPGPDALDRFVLLATAATAAGLLSSPTYYYHYAGLEAPFIAVLYAALTTRLAGRFRVSWAAAVPLVVAGLMLGVRLDAIDSAPPPAQVAAAFRGDIPVTGCVFATNPTVAILDDRFTADVRGCPHVVDWLAQQRVLDHGLALHLSDVRNPVWQAELLRWIKSSAAIVADTHNPGSDRVIMAYLRGHFHGEWSRGTRHYLYVRIDTATEQTASRRGKLKLTPVRARRVAVRETGGGPPRA